MAAVAAFESDGIVASISHVHSLYGGAARKHLEQATLVVIAIAGHLLAVSSKSC